MKKTLIALLALSGMAMADVTTATHNTPGATTITAGTEIADGLFMDYDMTFGSNDSFTKAKEDLKSANISLGNYFIGDYTASFWVTGNSFSGNHMLLAFSHSTAADSYGYNGLTWNATAHTMTFGRGNYSATGDSITFTSGQSAVTGDLSSLIKSDAPAVNITLVSTQTGATADLQTVSLYINGELAHTFSELCTKMNGSGTQDPTALPETYTWVSQNSGVKYGTLKLTNEALGADQIRAFAGITPEPATATLSLLALAGLAARRRRH